MAGSWLPPGSPRTAVIQGPMDRVEIFGYLVSLATTPQYKYVQTSSVMYAHLVMYLLHPFAMSFI
jgi:hypothetical protein